MTENPDLRSVRVEVEAEPGLTADAPQVETPPNRSKAGLVAGLAGLGLLAVLLAIAVRPDGAPSAGTTSTTVPAPTTAAESVAASSDVSPSMELFEETSGSSQLQSVVRAPSGFLGLSWDQNSRQLPSVVRSLDGIDWSAVEVVFDVPDALPQPDTAFERIFEQLIRTDDGYALLMTTVWFDPDGDLSPSAARIERLVSADGAAWSVDPTLAAIEESGGLVRAISHGPDSFVYLRQPSSAENATLRELLETNVAEDTRFDQTCWAELLGDGKLGVYPCNEGDVVLVDQTDLIDPARFDSLHECAAVLNQGWTGDATFWVAHRGTAAAELTGTKSLLFPPQVGEDGVVVALDMSSPPGLDTAACDELIELDDPPPPAVVVWDSMGDGEPVRLRIPDEIDVIDLLSARHEPAIIGREMLILVGSAVMTSDLDTGAWTEVRALRFRVDDETAVRFTEDGSQLVHLDSSRVTVVDVSTGDIRWRDDVGGGNRPGFPWMLYADREVVFAQGGNSMFKVDLPAA